MTISRRNFLLGGSAVVLSGGYVLSMDPVIGDLPKGDVHIHNGKIIAIAPSVPATGVPRREMSGRVIMPGFVDTHWHMWNSIARGFATTKLGPFTKFMAALSRVWTPEASAMSVRLACAEAVQSGITTQNNWAHNIKARDFADAEVAAQKASGLRGRFSYGYPQAIGKGALMDIDGVKLMRDDAFNDEKRGLLSLGLCVRGPDRCDPAVWRGEWAAARELKLPITTHIASDRAAGAMKNIVKLHREGLLGPDVLMIHATHASDADLRLLAEAKSPLSISPWTELEVGYGVPPITRMMQAHVPMSLSVDNMMLAGQADTFGIMRVSADLAEQQAKLPDRSVLQWATMGGAEALGLSQHVGSLTIGTRADIIPMQTDRLNTRPMQNVDVMLTHAARPKDVPALLAEADEMIRRLRSQADI